MRVAFVLLALLGGLGIGLYLACWLIIPAAGADGEVKPAGVVAVAQACGAAVGLVVLSAVAAATTLFGFGWVVLAIAAAVRVGVVRARHRLGPAWALLPVAALTLPAVAVATSGLRLAPQAGTSVHAPATYFSPRLAAFVLQAFSAPEPAPAEELEALTPREREVLHHLARGYAYKQIGARLGISARTVESHVGAVLRKLQLSSRHEVTHWAAARGLIVDDDVGTL